MFSSAQVIFISWTCISRKNQRDFKKSDEILFYLIFLFCCLLFSSIAQAGVLYFVREGGKKRLTVKKTRMIMYIQVTWSKNRNVKVHLHQSEVTTPVLSRSNRESTEPQLNIFSRQPYGNVKRSQQGSFAISLHGRITVSLSPGGGRN